MRLKTTRGSKYGNRRSPSLLVGRTFDSAWEREYCEGLALQEKAGLISELHFQKTFKLEVNGELVGTYRADAAYYDEVGRYRVVDCKGVLTDLYRIKKKLMKACLGIIVEEVYKRRRSSREA